MVKGGDWRVDQGFDVEEFLARPLVARVATTDPSILPVWYLWEQGAFWWLTGSWSELPRRLGHDATVSLTVDVCDLETGTVKQVLAKGRAEVVGFDLGRARRKLTRYLGPDETSWDPRLRATFDDESVRFVRLAPATLRARDLSYTAATHEKVPLGGVGIGDPTEIPTHETAAFVSAVLTPPARLLEAGCGKGDLLAELVARGFEATGVDEDPEAVAEAHGRGLPVTMTDFLSYQDAGCDAVLFTSSLHHMHPLMDTLERAYELLATGGLLICEEFAVEAIDTSTAGWFYDLDSSLRETGVLRADEDARSDVQNPLDRWRVEHEFEPALHTGEEMLAAIEARFELRAVERVPYLYRAFASLLERSERGHRIALRLRELESRGIAQGWLAPGGLRVVARVVTHLPRRHALSSTKAATSHTTTTTFDSPRA